MIRAVLAWVITYVLAFALAELAPGEMAEQAARAGARLPDEARAPEARKAIVAAVEQDHGLGGGALARVGRAGWRAVTLDLGRSWRDGRPVREVIEPGLGATGGRAAAALVLAIVLGLGAGLGAAALSRVSERSFGSSERSFGTSEWSFGGAAIGFVVALGLALPAVWLCQLALAGSVEAAGSSTIAALILAVAPAAVIAAHARAAAEEMLRSPLAAAVRARGASERRLVWVHGARLAAPRLAPLMATTVGFALGAAPVVERALAVPGAGRTLAVAAASADVPVVAALAALAATAVALTAALAQVVARRADPRLAEGAGARG
jgi:peptide/nickel transport system permease protein